jgi:hypothetical protein
VDASIDLDAPALRAALEEAASARVLATAAAAGVAFESLELTAAPDGERKKHECLFPAHAIEAQPDPRVLHVAGRAAPKGARGPEDHDRFEWRVRFADDGRPHFEAEERRPGKRVEAIRSQVEAAPLRTRLDKLREAAGAGAPPIVWRGKDGTTVALKRRPALAAIAEMLPELPPPLVQEAGALARALEEEAAGRAAVEGADAAAFGNPDWLTRLAARKGSLDRLVATMRCAVCGFDSPKAPAERRFDTRQGGLWGEVGTAFVCAAGHEVVRVVEGKP